MSSFLSSPQLLYHSPYSHDRFSESYTPGDDQAIPFNSVEIPFSRKVLRQRRLASYQPLMTHLLDTSNSSLRVPTQFYRFEANHSSAPVRQEHFQLRHCLRVTSDNIICMTGSQEGQISTYDPVSHTHQSILSLSYPDTMKITAFSVEYPFIATGGMNGQLYMDSVTGDVKVRHSLSAPELGHITNSVEFVRFRGEVELMVGSNNKAVAFYDPNVLSVAKREFKTPENVNKVALSPDQKLIAFVSDEHMGRIISSEEMQEVYTLVGHSDFGFGLDWNPVKPYQLVTGNQDRTWRIWDIRMASNGEVKPMVTMFGRMAPVLSTHYSADGELILCAEAADFVHVVEAQLFEQEQEIDLFGEITGVALSRESTRASSLYIGIQDSHYTSLYELRRNSLWGEEELVTA